MTDIAKLHEIHDFLNRNPALADCVSQITYSEMHEIAEAFRALEQRSENELREECDAHLTTLESIREWKQRAEAAEAKLAALAKQEPVAWMNTREGDLTWPRVYSNKEKADKNRAGVTLNPMVKTQPLFTRAAPPAPFVVKLPPVADESHLPFAAMAWNAYRKEAIEAIKAAGGSVAE